MKALFKNTIFVAVLIGTSISSGYSQGMRTIDSLKIELYKPLPDTLRVAILSEIGYIYRTIQTDSSKEYCFSALKLARSVGFKQGEALTLANLGWTYRMVSDYYNAQKCLTESEKIANELGFSLVLAHIYQVRGLIYFDLKDYNLAEQYIVKSRNLYGQFNEKTEEVTIATEITLIDMLDMQGRYDTAFVVAQDLYKYALDVNAKGSYGITCSKVARAYLRLNKLDSASILIEKTLSYGSDEKITRVLFFANQMKGELFERKNQIDSAIYYINEAYLLAFRYKFYVNALQSSTLLTSLYNKKNDIQNAYKYLNITSALKDSVQGVKKMIGLQRLLIEEQNNAYTLKEEIIVSSNKRKQNIFLGLAGIFLTLILVQVWNNKRIQKSRDREKEQKEKVESTLKELKSTQAQLIQKEKLASLGELTAGIAHEIQNPLNFVNNFSELSVDLIKDIKEERQKIRENRDEELENELLADLSSNQEKINHHGKRASNIVKGMLEHSRASTGVKELTDINKLADEYLRLSYHGLRAKDKDFNADFKTDFEGNLPKIEVIPQDMGRVLLNLINNAFYAVNQRKQDVIARNEAISSYTPSVFVSTQQLENQIIIKVKDNGTGMSESVKAKIFQPFFTTKPTGQGTGLGLSLAYDIVTKGHGGTLTVESTKGVGTEFIVKLPNQ
jgi:two-component system, NtrC family, sensor kinase